MLEQAIYVPNVGKQNPKLCRATGYLVAAKEIYPDILKGLADLDAEDMMRAVGLHFTSGWKIMSTEKIYNRVFYHYQEIEGDTVKQHLWIEVSPIRYEGVEQHKTPH
jgi:hypothetical protein